MKVESRDGAVERQILTAMLVNDRVCAAVASRWNARGMFRSRWADVVGKWATDYCLKHNEAPRRHVESLFLAWSKKADQATCSLVESFLQSISDEYDAADEINADYVIDLAGKHFNECKVRSVIKEAEGLADSDPDAAWELLHQSDRVQIGRGSGVDVLHDEAAIRAAFDSNSQAPLFCYPGAAGEFLGVRDCFHRDCFVAFAGPKGRGKSFWLIDAAWRAMEQRCRVAFFAIGDMSQDQMMRRLMVRASRRPFSPGTVLIPESIRKEEKAYVLTYQEKTYEKHLSPQTALASVQKVLTHKIKSKQSYFRLSCHPTKSISVPGIVGTVREWERGGFTPDVIVIDYADLLAPVSTRDEGRDQINNSWIAMRAMAQTLHCLVLTATQTKATSYYADLITRDHFADDRRKIDHVNAFIGLNQSADEKRQGIMRLNFFALREEDYDERRVVACATCLPLANTCVRSCL